ncbi:MAG: GNAT family N-acetyltransferase [Planctomycetaceae bacterium]|nr:GNAT family N-acetyltransferase [Planctomycetaceae bacterium]
MSTRNLDKIFRPQRIAVVGASETPGKVGYILLHNLVGHGFDGVVYPINPRREAVQGIAAYASLEALPHAPDLAILCTPAATIPDLIRRCGQLGIPSVIVISAGFRETGASGKQLEQQILDARREFPGLRIVGPNCLGVIAPHARLNASFGVGMPRPGRVALLSQSGALCTAILDQAIAQEMGFSAFVSLGNMLDVGFDDLLDYLAADPQTDAVILYVESITKPREFLSAARAFSRRKPIVAYKAGRFEASAQAAGSHTGAMAGVDAVYDAAFQRAGIVRVFDVEDLFDSAEVLARSRVPAGPRLAIITNAGGPGVMALDTLLAEHGQAARLSPETITALNGVLPPFWSHGNPVDVLGDASADRYAHALRQVAADPGVDAVLVILTPQAMTDPTAVARVVAEQVGATSKPILAAWMGSGLVQAGITLLEAAGVPTYPTPERAIRAFLHLTTYAQRREVLLETPQEIPLDFAVDRQAVGEQLAAQLAQGTDWLDEGASKAVLAAYGMPVCEPRPAATSAAAVELAREMRSPVVLKVLSPQITHKTDVHGVRLNLQGDVAVAQAFEEIVSAARQLRPDADVQGVTVQPMITAVNGVELIVGLRRDPVFGPVMMVGMGGVMAELFQDRALELPPLNERLARRMVDSLRCRPLLGGYRGRPPVDIDQLVAILMRFSYLAADRPEIAEAEINPLLVTPEQMLALDARIRLAAPSTLVHAGRRNPHLAICPYPAEWSRTLTLDNGRAVRLRPIRPEDEPLWIELLANCSRESLHRRFGGLFAAATHEMATRYCYIDYDRELTLVAEIDEPTGRQLIGVGRLVADDEHQQAEYAVLVVDAWQGTGLGIGLTAACLDVARSWGLHRVTAFTAVDNQPMLAVFRHLGFQFVPTAQPQLVEARLDLAPAET